MIAWVVGVAALLGVSGSARADPPLPSFGMVGLAAGQVAVLSLVLTDAPDNLDCRVRAAFVNATGQVFIDSAGQEVMKDFTLQPNIADTLRLRSADILAAGQLRMSIRAVLTPVPNDPTESDCTYLIANMEIVNSNGQTSVIYSPNQPPRGGGNPSPH